MTRCYHEACKIHSGEAPGVIRYSCRPINLVRKNENRTIFANCSFSSQLIIF